MFQSKWLLAGLLVPTLGGITAAQEGSFPALQFGKPTIIEFKRGVTPKRPNGAYVYTFTVPNAPAGRRLTVDMAPVGGVPLEVQSVVLDPNRRKRGYENWGVYTNQQSPRKKGRMMWEMAAGGVPGEVIHLQLQAYGEGKVEVTIDDLADTPTPSPVAPADDLKAVLTELRRLADRIAKLEKEIDDLKRRR